MASRISVLELRSVRGTGGGPEKTILYGAARRDASRFDVTVCYVRDLRDDVFAIDERARGIGVDYVEVTERNSFDPAIWRTLRDLVQRKQIDIVHAHDYKTNALAFFLAKRLKVKALSTAHGYTGNSGRERYLYYPADKWLLSRFPLVIAVSTELKNDLIKHGARPNRIRVVLNGIDPRLFYRQPEKRLAIRATLGYGRDDVVIGSVGRLEQQKRFDVLLEAFAAVRPAHPSSRLVIVGDGSLREELVAKARTLNVSSQCAFLGHRDDIIDLHHAFDLFVQSSDYEGTPNAVLEAMAMETPLIATDVGGTRELAQPGEHGLIVPRRDVPALNNAIEQLLREPALGQRLAGAARTRVIDELSFEARTRTLERIYEELYVDRNAAHA